MNCPTCGQQMPQQQGAAPTAMPTPGGLAGAGATPISTGFGRIGGFTPEAQAAAANRPFDPSQMQATDIGSNMGRRPGGLQGLLAGFPGQMQATDIGSDMGMSRFRGGLMGMFG